MHYLYSSKLAGYTFVNLGGVIAATLADYRDEVTRYYYSAR
jgi:hypothetical protein